MSTEKPWKRDEQFRNRLVEIKRLVDRATENLQRVDISGVNKALTGIRYLASEALRLDAEREARS